VRKEAGGLLMMKDEKLEQTWSLEKGRWIIFLEKITLQKHVDQRQCADDRIICFLLILDMLYIHYQWCHALCQGHV
jgi:hypothetical protein